MTSAKTTSQILCTAILGAASSPEPLTEPTALHVGRSDLVHHLRSGSNYSQSSFRFHLNSPSSNMDATCHSHVLHFVHVSTVGAIIIILSFSPPSWTSRRFSIQSYPPSFPFSDQTLKQQWFDISPFLKVFLLFDVVCILMETSWKFHSGLLIISIFHVLGLTAFLFLLLIFVFDL